jgi:hypothetical protein
MFSISAKGYKDPKFWETPKNPVVVAGFNTPALELKTSLAA